MIISKRNLLYHNVRVTYKLHFSKYCVLYQLIISLFYNGLLIIIVAVPDNIFK